MKPTLRILYLGDDQLHLDRVVAALSAEGESCGAARAANGAEFAALLARQECDLILASYRLTAADGFSALALARKKNPDLPYIVFSGQMGEAKASDALKRGATDCLPKESLVRLVPSIRRALRGAAERELLHKAELREAYLERLNQLVRVSQEVLAETTLAGLLQKVTDCARELTGSRHAACGFGFLDGTFRVAVSAAAGEAPFLPRFSDFRVEKGGVYLRLMGRESSFHLADAELKEQPEWWGVPEWHFPLRGLAGARLVGREGEPVGLIMVTDRVDGLDFSGEDEALLLQLASLASLGIQHIEAREEALRQSSACKESEERYRHLVEHSPDAIVVHDGERYLFANDAALGLFGASGHADLVGREVIPLIHADYRETVRERIARVRETGTPSPLGELKVLRLDGAAVETESTGTVVNYEGRPAFQIVIRDITERKRAERTQRHSEAILAQAGQIASLGAWEIEISDPGDINAGPLRWSDEVYRIFGYQPGEVEVTNELFFRMVHPEDRQRIVEAVADAIALKKPYSIEHRIVRPDGSERTIFEHAEITFDDRDRPVHIIGAVQDITGRKRAEEALKKAHDQLEKRVTERTIELAQTVETLLEEITERRKAEEALQAETAERLRAMEELREKDRLLMQQSRQAAMGEMIGNIAHQWRQPLNTLGLIIQQLAAFYDTEEFTGELLDSCTEKAMELIFHMSQTIDDFRNFFRPDKEKVVFSANEVVARTISMVHGSFTNHGIRITLHAPQELTIHGFANEFCQVLLTILSNARDAFAGKGIERQLVTVRLFGENGRTVVTVADNAGGIAAENLGKIFDPYFTTKGPDKGTGVGLYMAKTIIEASMNGSLSACNRGKGAEFRIEVTNGEP